MRVKQQAYRNVCDFKARHETYISDLRIAGISRKRRAEKRFRGSARVKNDGESSLELPDREARDGRPIIDRGVSLIVCNVEQ